MDKLYGLRIVFRPEVPVGRAIVHRERGVIAFRDRYSLHTALFWARLGPILDNLADEAIVAYRRDPTGKEAAMLETKRRTPTERYRPRERQLTQCARCHRFIAVGEVARDSAGEIVCADGPSCARRQALVRPDGE